MSRGPGTKTDMNECVTTNPVVLLYNVDNLHLKQDNHNEHARNPKHIMLYYDLLWSLDNHESNESYLKPSKLTTE